MQTTLMGIITNTAREELLKEITQRCMAAVPFGGRYRLIDFVLSNMVNSGIHNVGIVTSHKYRALMDHLGAGKDWGLDRKSDGLFILPSASPNIIRKTLKYDLKDLHANLDYLQKSRQKYLVISGNNMICNLNYRKVLDFHKEKAADATIIYKEEKNSWQDFNNFTFLDIATNDRVTGIHETPKEFESNKICMEMVILERALLLDIIDVAYSSGNWDLGDILLDNIDKLKIFGYHHKGYLAKINSVESYYKHNMDLLEPDIWNELFLGLGPIYTKAKNGPPAKYSEDSQVKNVLVATGCDIRGKVENSIIFRGVTIKSGAYINNSIIMQKSEIEENVVLENVILDKEVIIRKGKILKGEKDHPIVIGKKTVI